MTRLKTFAISAVLALGAAGAHAAPTVVTSTGSGWINAFGNANSSGFNTGFHNNFAGLTSGTVYNDYFDFALPTTAVSAATISIFNDASNFALNPATIFSLHAPSSFTFSGLGAGASFGTVTAAVANTGINHMVDITLNSAGIAYINANLGGTISFGGTTDASGSTNQFFGYTGGLPAATLTLTAGVPEPASWALMVSGFGLIGLATRRRKVAVAA